MKKLNQKGQAFDVFRLLIGALIGLAILVIIIGIINYLETWKYEISQRMIFEGLDNAIDSPNGEVIVRNNLTLKKGAVFSSASFAEASGLKRDCVKIQASNLSAFELQGNSVLEMKSNLLLNVYYQCKNPPDNEDPACRPYCIVSFAEELRPE